VNEQYVEELSKGPRQGQDGIAHGIADHRDPGGRRHAFVPTNVISITDGQIFLETDFSMPACARPSTRASRCRASRRCADEHHQEAGRGVRLALAQYRELAAFSSSRPISTRRPAAARARRARDRAHEAEAVCADVRC